MNGDNEKLRFSKKVVVAAIIAVVGYTLIHLTFNWFDKVVQTELTVGWFAFWGVEVVALMQKAVAEVRACGCKGGGEEHAGDRGLSDSNGPVGDYPSNRG